MTTLRLIVRSLVFYRRTHAGIAAGAAVATAVLVGALVVGDSVRYSLRTAALSRLGRVELALASGERFLRARAGGGGDDLATALADEIGSTVAPVLLLDGSAKTPDGSARANRVQVVGVDARFWSAGGAPDLLAGTGSDEAVVNVALAEQLGLSGAGATIVVRVPVPSPLPRDAPLAAEKDAVRGMSLTVRAIAGDEDFGRFGLRANQITPFTVFVPLGALQAKVALAGRANTLLVAGGPGPRRPAPDEAARALRKHWTVLDADLRLRRLADDVLEVRTGRVFLDPPAAVAAEAADSRSLSILTYFVNEIRRGERSSPYCIVAAMEPTPPAPRADSPGESIAPGPESPVPAALRDDEIVLNRWLADDLGARAGDEVAVTYSTIGPMRTFVDARRTFRVHSVVPIDGPARDPNLMPDFPGLAGTKTCRDWDPGIPIDLKKLEDPNDKYNQYWQRYRGTPKAFVTLSAGQGMWGNRFGKLTAVRYRAGPADEPGLTRAILDRLDPAEIGLFFLPVREQALAAANPTSDFGGLFLGLSFFLIVSAILLTGLLFVFGVEQRSRQAGVMLAVGFRPWHVRRLLLAESGVLALLGCAVGAAGGLGYTRAVLLALATVWREVSVSAPIRFHAEATTVALGAGIALAVAVGAMLAALVLQGRAVARELLSAGAAGRASPAVGRGKLATALGVGIACIAGAAVLVVLAASTEMLDPAGAFFGSGSLLLIGSLSLCYTLLASAGTHQATGARSLTALGIRTAGRRRWRSLTTVGLLACGVFLVASVEVFRLDPNKDAGKRTSGTGGFALYGASAVPVLNDLNDPDRRAKLGLAGPELDAARVVQLRVREGDDASCLNLNRAQRPRLLGVVPDRLTGRFTFVQTLAGRGGDDPWSLLDAPAEPRVVPAIGDHDTLRWALHKSVGEMIDVTDERGRRVRLKLVGEIAGSIFQGNLLISERRFRELFPSTSGYRAFLVDVPAGADRPARTAAVARQFSMALEDFALELTPAARRLAGFSEVQNSYLSIFAALGGLGLLLGSVAIGVVVLRNVLERRGELALLQAVGFTRGALRWMVLCEHWALLGLGLACGVVSAVVAVLPALLSPSAAVPYVSWLAMLVGVALSGAGWTYLAATAALRGDLLEALRSE